MKDNQFSRTELLLGRENVNKLKKNKVVIFGVGGVGCCVVEALVRSGIENFILVDKDIIDITNLNRQIYTNLNNIGRSKVEELQNRIKLINKNANVEIYKQDILEMNLDTILKNVDYIVDSVDTISAKIKIIEKAYENNILIISSMGTGNKLNPLKFEITDIYKTEMCPLARIMRKELKKRNIKKLKVLYSKEESIKSKNTDINIIGSVSFVPTVAGFVIGGEVIKDLIGG